MTADITNCCEHGKVPGACFPCDEVSNDWVSPPVEVGMRYTILPVDESDHTLAGLAHWQRRARGMRRQTRRWRRAFFDMVGRQTATMQATGRLHAERQLLARELATARAARDAAWAEVARLMEIAALCPNQCANGVMTYGPRGESYTCLMCGWVRDALAPVLAADASPYAPDTERG